MCTSEAALRPEKDLLGMCPGGKKHYFKEQLEDVKLFNPPRSKCDCDACRFEAH